MTNDTKNIGTKVEILSPKAKKNGFHEQYLKICKSKNIKPVAEVRGKNRSNIQELDFHADRLRPIDWIAITTALRQDKTLKLIAIRLRKNTGKGQLLLRLNV